MKLKTQGLIVIFCPLAFQLVLVLMLIVSILNAQREFEDNLRSESVVNECNLIVSRIFDGMGAMILSKFGHEEAVGTVDEARESFEKQVDQLHRLIANDPAHRTSDAELMQQSKAVLNISSINARVSMGIPGRVERTEISKRLVAILSVIAQTESQKLATANETKTKQRAELRIMMICVALFGIVVSALVALVCALRIRKLVAHMTDNAGRFSRREPLMPALNGTDEMAELDQVIHAMDQAIEVALQKARALIDNAADMVCSIDRDGYFERVNRFSRRLLGVDPGALVGTPVINLVIADDCARADEQINKSFESPQANHFDLRLLTTEQRIVETAWSTFWSQADRSLFCVVGDITERKNIERLKQDFIGMISHDLRSPLMSIGSSIALVQSGALGPVSDGVTRDLDGAEKTVDRLIAMINDLLDFEKMDAGKMQFALEPVSTDEVINEAFREVQALAQSKQIILDSKMTGNMVLGDREKLIQMLINLLGNAIRYSPNGAAVSVKATRLKDKVEVAVMDRGPGVPDEFHAKVFAPFENAPGAKQSKEGGTGLGLAICKLIIQGHDGEIGVRNRPGGGSEFWFSLDSGNDSFG